MAPVLVSCQALPCGNAAGCCSLGPGHKTVVCRTVGDPRASAGFLVGGVRVPKTSELLPTHWQVRQGPGVIAKLLAGTAVSCILAAGPRKPRTRFRYFGRWGGVVSDTFGYGVHDVLKHVHLLLGRTRALLVSG